MNKKEEVVSAVVASLAVFVVAWFVASGFLDNGAGDSGITGYTVLDGCIDTDSGANAFIVGTTTNVSGAVRTDYCETAEITGHVGDLRDFICLPGGKFVQSYINCLQVYGDGYVCVGSGGIGSNSNGRCAHQDVVDCSFVSPTGLVSKSGSDSIEIVFNYTGILSNYTLAVGSSNWSGFTDEELCRVEYRDFDSSKPGNQSFTCSWSNKPNRDYYFNIAVFDYELDANNLGLEGIDWGVCGSSDFTLGAESFVRITDSYDKVGIGNGTVLQSQSNEDFIRVAPSLVSSQVVPQGTYSNGEYVLLFTFPVASSFSGDEYDIVEAKTNSTGSYFVLESSFTGNAPLNHAFDIFKIGDGSQGFCSIFQPNSTVVKDFSDSVFVSFNSSGINAKNYTSKISKTNSTSEVVLCNRSGSINFDETNFTCSWTSNIANISEGLYSVVVNVTDEDGDSFICSNGLNKVRLDQDSGTSGQCGNNIIDAGEDCDGIEFGLNTCETVGNYDSGVLGCLSNCRYDTSGCISTTPLPINGCTGDIDCASDEQCIGGSCVKQTTPDREFPWFWVILTVGSIVIVALVVIIFLRIRANANSFEGSSGNTSTAKPRPGFPGNPRRQIPMSARNATTMQQLRQLAQQPSNQRQFSRQVQQGRWNPKQKKTFGEDPMKGG